MKKRKIKFNEGQYQNDMRTQNGRIPFFQGIVDEYNALGLDRKLSPGDLPELYKNPVKFLTDALMAGKDMNLGGVKIKPEKLFDIIEKPSNFDAFLNSLKTKKVEDRSKYGLWVANYHIKDDGKTVALNDEVEEKIRNNHSLFVETDLQEKALTLCEEIAEKLNELKKLKGGYMYEDLVFQSLIRKKSSIEPSSDFEAIPELIKQF